MRRILWILGIAIVLVFAGMQFHSPKLDVTPTNATAGFEALHPVPEADSVLKRSCNSCHSAQSEIPWYGHVWPASALMESNIRHARARMDLSNWDNLSLEMSHIRLVAACQAMRESKMPLWYYEPLHPGSKPTQYEVETFCDWVYLSPLKPELAELH